MYVQEKMIWQEDLGRCKVQFSYFENGILFSEMCATTGWRHANWNGAVQWPMCSFSMSFPSGNYRRLNNCGIYFPLRILRQDIPFSLHLKLVFVSKTTRNAILNFFWLSAHVSGNRSKKKPNWKSHIPRALQGVSFSVLSFSLGMSRWSHFVLLDRSPVAPTQEGIFGASLILAFIMKTYADTAVLFLTNCSILRITAEEWVMHFLVSARKANKSVTTEFPGEVICHFPLQIQISLISHINDNKIECARHPSSIAQSYFVAHDCAGSSSPFWAEAIKLGAFLCCYCSGGDPENWDRGPMRVNPSHLPPSTHQKNNRWKIPLYLELLLQNCQNYESTIFVTTLSYYHFVV